MRMYAHYSKLKMLAVAFAFLCLLLPGFWAYASDVYVVGDKGGLTISPKIAGAANALFSYSKMTPGDTVSSAVTIKNTLGHSFVLDLEVSALPGAQGAPNLAEKLALAIYDQGNNKLAEFFELDSLVPYKYSFPGVFLPETETFYTFVVSLPGAAAGNEYQNASAQLEFVFTAFSSEPPEPPPAAPLPLATLPLGEGGEHRRSVAPRTTEEPAEKTPATEIHSDPANFAESETRSAPGSTNEDLGYVGDGNVFLGNLEITEPAISPKNAEENIAALEDGEKPAQPPEEASESPDKKSSLWQFVESLLAPSTGDSLLRLNLATLLVAIIFLALAKKAKKPKNQ